MKVLKSEGTITCVQAHSTAGGTDQLEVTGMKAHALLAVKQGLLSGHSDICSVVVETPDSSSIPNSPMLGPADFLCCTNFEKLSAFRVLI